MNDLTEWLISNNLTVTSNDSEVEVGNLAIKTVNLNEIKSDLPANHNVEFYNRSITNNKRPIIIYGDEWTERKPQCKNFLKSLLGLANQKMFARKCTIHGIHKEQGREFIEQHHIQGANRLGMVFWGLFYNEELLGVISLGRHSRQVSENHIVLDRLCFKDGVQVIGGASKLFAHCIQWAENQKYDCIISFSDNRWSLGGVYTKLNFCLEREYKPDYSYIDTASITRLSKQSQKKEAVDCPEELTEHQWALQRGLVRVYDCGKKRWNYKIDPLYLNWKEKNSIICAKQNSAGLFKHNHIRGWFKSKKNKKEVYYGSSYELRCIYLLEADTNVQSYDRCEPFQIENRGRSPDFFIKYYSGIDSIIEVKPKWALDNEDVKLQIADSIKHCENNNWIFKIWTEDDSLLVDEKAIIKWAKEFLKVEYKDDKFEQKQLERSRQKAKKHYDAKITTDKVTVYCEFCKENHTQLQLTYDKNVTKNGRFICIKENGHIVGKRDKTHLKNPLEAEGKKKCSGKCGLVLTIEGNFSPNGSGKWCSQCKKCRSKKAQESYGKAKNNAE